MLANDGVVNTFEWEAECSLTELMTEELLGLQELLPYHSMGYSQPFAWVDNINANGQNPESGVFSSVHSLIKEIPL